MAARIHDDPIDVDIWTLIARHLQNFPHPPRALSDQALIRCAAPLATPYPGRRRARGSR